MGELPADEDTSTATSLLEHMVGQDWADSYSQWDEVIRALGEGVALNKLALLSKTKSDGSVKRRLVCDLRRSGVNLALKHGGRVVLPHLSDVVADLRELAATNRDEAFLRVGHGRLRGVSPSTPTRVRKAVHCRCPRRQALSF